MQTATPEVTDVAQELRRFLVVAAEYKKTTGEQAFMPACPVDQYWHELVEQPLLYARLCEDVVGGHIAHTPITGAGEIPWAEIYENHFGELSTIWFQDLEGSLNTPDLEHYKNTGVFRASWDCSPYFTPPVVPAKAG